MSLSCNNNHGWYVVKLHTLPLFPYGINMEELNMHSATRHDKKELQMDEFRLVWELSRMLWHLGQSKSLEMVSGSMQA